MFVQLEGNPKEELIAETVDLFISLEVGGQLQFIKEPGVAEIKITAGNYTFVASKIE